MKVGATDADAFLVVANHLKSKGAGAPALPGRRRGHLVPGGRPGRVQRDPGARGAGRQHVRLAGRRRASAPTGSSCSATSTPTPTKTRCRPCTRTATPTWAARFDPSEQTYSFDGLEGSLDHVLANPARAARWSPAPTCGRSTRRRRWRYTYSRYNYNVTLLFNGTDPFAASDHDPVVVGLNLPVTPTAPAWNASKVYNNGDTVTYQGSTWQAMWWTQNQTPGDPYGPWEQIATAADGTAIWTPSRVFNGRRRRGLPGPEVPRTVVDPQPGAGPALRPLAGDRLTETDSPRAAFDPDRRRPGPFAATGRRAGRKII